MAAIVYLDVDDEITSAASRIRSVDERRVVLVVPYGSRLATSRINFRLLAREAQTRGRRLWIVAADAATRALAASAGLAVFGSVGEYESALEAPSPADGDGDGGAGVATTAATSRRRARRRAAETESPGPVDEAAAAPSESASDGTAADELDATMAVPAAALGAAAAASAPAASVPAPGASVVAPVVESAAARAPVAARSSSSNAATSTLPIIRSRREWPIARGTAVAVAVVLALVLALGGVAAYVFLPSASITVTAYPQTLPPLELTVRADPSATQVDPDNDVVPAQKLSLPVQTNGTFKVKGKRVEESAASGAVMFQNLNPFATNTIAGGSIVSTEGGIGFRLDRSVTVPPATFSGAGEASVTITAVDKGTTGNVPANSITVVPKGENPAVTRVRNDNPTSGGTHTESPEVKKADIQAALDKLNQQLAAEFDKALTDPSKVPPGMTIVPDTKSLGTRTPTADTDSLVGQDIESFDLGMTATGSVTAVDEKAVQEFAASRMGERASPDHRLVDGSVKVTPGAPRADGDVAVFPMSVTGQEVRVLDGNALLAQVKGKPVPQARSILEQFGVVDLSVWPDWVTAIPTIDARVSLRTETASTPRQPGSSGSPASTQSSERPANGQTTPASTAP